MAIPEGCYGRIAPRSGLAVKHSIDVGAGVIDTDYRGTIQVLLFNFGKEDFLIRKGDCIAQLIIEKIALPVIRDVDDLEETTRGEEGFGFTGINAMNLANPSTRIAQKHIQKDDRTIFEILPKWLHDKHEAFLPRRANRFPPSRPFDHKIVPKEGYIPKVAHPYALPIRDREALDQFIKENLALGFIKKSNSDQASPVFFVPKKDGTGCLCQDY